LVAVLVEVAVTRLAFAREEQVAAQRVERPALVELAGAAALELLVGAPGGDEVGLDQSAVFLQGAGEQVAALARRRRQRRADRPGGSAPRAPLPAPARPRAPHARRRRSPLPAGPRSPVQGRVVGAAAQLGGASRRLGAVLHGDKAVWMLVDPEPERVRSSARPRGVDS
jgi:hypothetical protein